MRVICAPRPGINGKHAQTLSGAVVKAGAGHLENRDSEDVVNLSCGRCTEQVQKEKNPPACACTTAEPGRYEQHISFVNRDPRPIPKMPSRLHVHQVN